MQVEVVCMRLYVVRNKQDDSCYKTWELQRGHSTITWTELCHFLTPHSHPLPAWTVFIPWAWTNTNFFDPLPQWDIYAHGYCVSLQKYCRSKSNFFILCPSLISHCAPPTQPRPWYCQHCYWMAPKLKWCCDSSIHDVVHLVDKNK